MRQSFSFPASSHLGRGEYDPADPEKGTEAVLTIEFRRGGVYAYKNVPQDIVDRMKEDAQPGRIFEREVKRAYPTERIA